VSVAGAPEPFLPLGMSFAPTPKSPISEVTFAFLDTETTGLSPAGGARVCEVAVVTSRGGARLELYQTLLNPGCPIDPGAQRVHGITDAMVAKSPRFPEVVPKLKEILETSVMVCHNAPFDVGFMTAEFSLAGHALPAMPILDTLPLARKHFRFPSNSLGNIARTMGVQPEGWHRAGNDVEMLRQVFDKMLAQLAPKGLKTLGDLLKLAGHK